MAGEYGLLFLHLYYGFFYKKWKRSFQSAMSYGLGLPSTTIGLGANFKTNNLEPYFLNIKCEKPGIYLKIKIRGICCFTIK